MSDYPFRPAAVAVNKLEQSPFATLTFKNATLGLYINGGEIYASVDGELTIWDLRNLECMSRGLYPLYAGLMLEHMHTESQTVKQADVKLSRLLEHLPLPVHHNRS